MNEIRKKGLAKKLWDWAGSREFSIFIFIAAITYSLISYVFALLVPKSWFDIFQTLLPMTVLYVLFFINLLICEIKWIPVVIRRCRRPEPPVLTQLGRYRQVVINQSLSGDKLKDRLPKAYTLCEQEEEGKKITHAFRGAYSPLGNLLFHISYFFLLTGILIGLLFRFDGTALVAEGTKFNGSEKSYQSVSLSPYAVLPDINFTLNSVNPEFWGNELLFTDLRADITLTNGRKESAWLSSPVRIGGAKVSIAGIGYAFRYRLTDDKDNELANGMELLNVFMPGVEEGFKVPGYPHRFLVAYYPDAVIKNESVINRSMNRINPVIGLRVYRGRLPVYSGLMREGEKAEFDSLKFSIEEVKYWGDFKAVKNPGFPWIWAAFAMMVVGLIWRFIFCRKEIVVVENEGGVSVYCRSEFFPGLFEGILKSLLERI